MLKESPFLSGVLVVMLAAYFISEPRGHVPKDGPLVFIGLLLIFVLIGIGGILDLLLHINKKLK